MRRGNQFALRALLALGAVAAWAAVAPAPAPVQRLTLDEAIRLALQNNQALKVSAFSPLIARANLLSEYGRFEPSLAFRREHGEAKDPVSMNPLVTELTQTDDYRLSLDGTTPWGMSYSLGGTASNRRGDFNGFTGDFVTFGGVSITQPLLRGFGFGANLAGLRIAKADRTISDWQHRQAVIDTVTGVVFVYNNLAQARENVKIARLSRDLTAQLVDQNQKRNRVGQISDADVIQARARLATREESILFAERSARDLENQLRQLVGEAAFFVDGSALELEPLPPATPIAVDTAADVQRAFQFRPDYQAAKLGIGRQRIAETLARQRLLPSVDFTGSYGYSGSARDFATARRQIRHEDISSYSVGVVVSIPLTFAEGRGRARAARLGVRQAEAELVRFEQDIALDIAAAAGQIETTRQRVAATRGAVELAQLALEAEEKKLQAGTGRTLDVLTAQGELSGAQNSHARALADERRAIASYERELGITLLRYNITLE